MSAPELRAANSRFHKNNVILFTAMPTIGTDKNENDVLRLHPSCGVRYAPDYLGGGVAARQSKLVLCVRICDCRKCSIHMVFVWDLRVRSTIVIA